MKNTKLIFFLTVILSVITLSCRDSYDKDESFPQGSDFRIVNAATQFSNKPFNLYQSDNLFLESLLYGTDSKYFRTAESITNINIKIKNVEGVENAVFNINESNVNNQNVTYFLYNPSATSTNIEYVKTIDDISRPDPKKAKIRLANLVSNLPANVDFRIGNTVIASNVPFKKVTDFVTVSTTDVVTVVYTGTNTIVKALVPYPSLASKGVYTYVLGGNVTGNNPLFLTQFSNNL